MDNQIPKLYVVGSIPIARSNLRLPRVADGAINR
jgi:hypothetical protein